MLFHTWIFFAFFLIFYVVYVVVRRTRWMNLWILIGSYAFYASWNPLYLILIIIPTTVDYVAVRLMETTGRRRLWLCVSLFTNLGFLAAFKYADFVTENLNALLDFLGTGLQFTNPVQQAMQSLGMAYLLPVGISFFTFQSMSYTIDAYRGRLSAEHSFIRYASFVSLFPQLVAGPIERASHLLPQLRTPPRITRQDITDGLSLFLVGLFKKVALADYLGQYVDTIYGSPSAHDASALVLATFAFGWQIYFDFSGYTDMARGVARLMGFRLMLNFNNPYTATGLSDFWSRWHISLSTWFKDYVYIPLGGNRHGKLRTYRNIFLTMVISGLWHGAAWGFIIWGALHAVGMMLTRELERSRTYRERVPKLAKQILVFGFVTFAWIFFRAPTWEKSSLIVSRIFTGAWSQPEMPRLLLAMVLLVWIYQLLYSSDGNARKLLDLAPVRVGLAVAMSVYLAVLAQTASQPFIYFQF